MQSFDFKRTGWKLFQKRILRTKLDIHVFIIIFQYESYPINTRTKCEPEAINRGWNDGSWKRNILLNNSLHL
jgi:hypothetical protein